MHISYIKARNSTYMVYIYIYTHAYIHTYIHTTVRLLSRNFRERAYKHAGMYMWVIKNAHSQSHFFLLHFLIVIISAYICIYMHIYAQACAYVRTYILSCTNLTLLHTQEHTTYMYTQIREILKNSYSVRTCIYTCIWRYWKTILYSHPSTGVESVSHNCFYYTSKPECAIPDDKWAVNTYTSLVCTTGLYIHEYLLEIFLPMVHARVM